MRRECVLHRIINGAANTLSLPNEALWFTVVIPIDQHSGTRRALFECKWAVLSLANAAAVKLLGRFVVLLL